MKSIYLAEILSFNTLFLLQLENDEQHVGTQDQESTDGSPSDEESSNAGSSFSALDYSDIQPTSSPCPSRSSSPSPTISISEPSVNRQPLKKAHKSAKSESEIELQKLVVLKELSNTVQAGFKSPGDAEFTFGKQVAAELKQINDPTLRTRAKKSIVTVLYDIQEQDQNLTRHAHYGAATPYTPQGVFQAQPQGQVHSPPLSYHQTYRPPQVPQQQPSFMQLLHDTEENLDG